MKRIIGLLLILIVTTNFAARRERMIQNNVEKQVIVVLEKQESQRVIILMPDILYIRLGLFGLEEKITKTNIFLIATKNHFYYQPIIKLNLQLSLISAQVFMVTRKTWQQRQLLQLLNLTKNHLANLKMLFFVALKRKTMKYMVSFQKALILGLKLKKN